MHYRSFNTPTNEVSPPLRREAWLTCIYRVKYMGLFYSPFIAFRSKMMKIVSQLAVLIPRTAASEALLVTEQLVQKKMDSGKGSL